MIALPPLHVKQLLLTTIAAVLLVGVNENSLLLRLRDFQ